MTKTSSKAAVVASVRLLIPQLSDRELIDVVLLRLIQDPSAVIDAVLIECDGDTNRKKRATWKAWQRFVVEASSTVPETKLLEVASSDLAVDSMLEYSEIAEDVAAIDRFIAPIKRAHRAIGRCLDEFALRRNQCCARNGIGTEKLWWCGLVRGHDGQCEPERP
jgi:hypothetical protein